jgi:hypothetical protein
MFRDFNRRPLNGPALRHRSSPRCSFWSREKSDTIPHAGQRQEATYGASTSSIIRFQREASRDQTPDAARRPRQRKCSIELLELAESIHTDITRAYDATKVLTLGYNYNGPATWQR